MITPMEMGMPEWSTTLLKPEATTADVESLCREASTSASTACVSPPFLPLSSELLGG